MGAEDGFQDASNYFGPSEEVLAQKYSFPCGGIKTIFPISNNEHTFYAHIAQIGGLG